MSKRAKTIIILSLLTLAVLTLVGFGWGDVVGFADPALEGAIREHLGIMEGDIHDTDLDLIENLNAVGLGITDIGGISRCKNLEVLDLSENAVADLSELEALPNLKALLLGENGLENILPLADLTNLTSLSLAYNRFDSYDLDVVLSNLVNLEFLNLSGNHLIELGAVSGLVNLEVLHLEDNQFTGISGLVNCTKLTHLNLHKNKISEISILAQLTDLQFVDLYTNEIVDFAPVQHVPTVFRDRESDVDDDRMLDTWEVTHFGSLFRDGTEDSDGDGLSDLREYQNKTNPKDSDTDVDGMPDGWEVANRLDPLRDDALADQDGDGITNVKEFIAGTHPGVWNLLVTLLSPEEGASLSRILPPTFTWESSSSARFKLEFSSKATFSRRSYTVPSRRRVRLYETSYRPTFREWRAIQRKGCIYWRVRAKGQDGNEYLSGAHSFKTRNTRLRLRWW